MRIIGVEERRGWTKGEGEKVEGEEKGESVKIMNRRKM